MYVRNDEVKLQVKTLTKLQFAVLACLGVKCNRRSDFSS